jgi:hypothetical protein
MSKIAELLPVLGTKFRVVLYMYRGQNNPNCIEKDLFCVSVRKSQMCSKWKCRKRCVQGRLNDKVYDMSFCSIFAMCSNLKVTYILRNHTIHLTSLYTQIYSSCMFWSCQIRRINPKQLNIVKLSNIIDCCNVCLFVVLKQSGCL